MNRLTLVSVAILVAGCLLIAYDEKDERRRYIFELP